MQVELHHLLFSCVNNKIICDLSRLPPYKISDFSISFPFFSPTDDDAKVAVPGTIGALGRQCKKISSQLSWAGIGIVYRRRRKNRRCSKLDAPLFSDRLLGFGCCWRIDLQAQIAIFHHTQWESIDVIIQSLSPPARCNRYWISSRLSHKKSLISEDNEEEEK